MCHPEKRHREHLSHVQVNFPLHNTAFSGVKFPIYLFLLSSRTYIFVSQVEVTWQQIADNKCVSNVLCPQLLLSRAEFNFSDTKVLITSKSKAIARKMCLEGHRFKTVEQSYSPSFTKSSQEEFAFFVFISFYFVVVPIFCPCHERASLVAQLWVPHTNPSSFYH